MPYRIGSGIDFHKLAEGRELWIGGVRIEHHKGALGHSDADVLLHAICDALLGAASLGDIGDHFPDTDNAYKNVKQRQTLGVAGKKYGEVNIIVDTSKSYGWYDFSVRIKGNGLFEKRYAGRVETGKSSKTDPLMGKTL